MSTALQQWREHRVDYRAPGLAALLLLLGLAILLPADWLALSWLGSTRSKTFDAPQFSMTDDEGMQILDVRILAPAALPDLEQAAAPQRMARGTEFEAAPELEGGDGEFSWDPTHGFRLGDELVMPEDRGEQNGPDELLRSLEFLLSSEGVASYTLSDTSHAALARANFTRLQRQIFLRDAPGWAYDKAVERYRELMTRMLYENPLRGPQ